MVYFPNPILTILLLQPRRVEVVIEHCECAWMTCQWYLSLLKFELDVSRCRRENSQFCRHATITCHRWDNKTPHYGVLSIHSIVYSIQSTSDNITHDFIAHFKFSTNEKDIFPLYIEVYALSRRALTVYKILQKLISVPKNHTTQNVDAQV